MLGQRQGNTALLLQLSSSSLEGSPDDKPDRVDVCNDRFENGKNERMSLKEDSVSYGLQVRNVCPETMEKDKQA